MSLKSDRISIYPSRASQLQLKIRLIGAQKGYTMLKKKSDAIQLKFRNICSNLANNKLCVQEAIKEANYSLARAKYIGVDFETIVLQNVHNAQIHLKLYQEQIAGITTINFQLVHNDKIYDCEPFQLIGLSRGGQQIIEIRKNFQDLLKLLIDMATLELSYNNLKNNLISLNRRINTIQYILIPKLENTLTYVNSELDEIEREEFYRLKKIQNKKKKFIPNQCHIVNIGDGSVCKKSSSFPIDLLNIREEDVLF